MQQAKHSTESTLPTATRDSTEPVVDLQELHQYDLPTAALGLCLDPDGKHAWVSCMDGVYQVALATGDWQRLYGHESYASSVAYFPRLQSIVSAGYDGQVCWYDLSKRSIYRRVRAHDFWSWQMRKSDDDRFIASVSGQYLAGSLDYRPAKSPEPTVKVYDAVTGDLKYAFEHLPPVQSVAFSPDGQYLAAGNLMGDVAIWDLRAGKRCRQWRTDALTSWGIIKSHCYIGGIYAMNFTADGQSLYVAGMGPMRDPMAGNGKQLWQKFAWPSDPPVLASQTRDEDSGEGLMETLAVHPNGKWIWMGGRLRGGKWNGALFDAHDGPLLSHVNTGYRMTDSAFLTTDGRQWLVTCGADKQPPPAKADKPFGKLQIYQLNADYDA